MSKLLINEHPLQVLPSLACHVGLNEAIVLQQVHYWLGMKNIGKEADGRKWVRNSVREWRKENFPFWSEDTVQRSLASLVKRGALITRNDLAEKNLDRSLWYSIDYEWLDRALQPAPPITATCTNGLPQLAPMDYRNLHQCTIYTETTSEIITTTPAPAPSKLDRQQEAAPLPPPPPPAPSSPVNATLLGFTTPQDWFKDRQVNASANAHRILMDEAGIDAKTSTELVDKMADILGKEARINQGEDSNELIRLRGLILILCKMNKKYRTPEGLQALADDWHSGHPQWAFPTGHQLVDHASQQLKLERNGHDTVTRQPANTPRRSTGNGRPEPVIKDYTERAREQQRRFEEANPEPVVAAEIDY